MGQLIENRPISCERCGASVSGKESSTRSGNKIMHECQWVCPRCCTFIRSDEATEIIEEPKTPEAK